MTRYALQTLTLTLLICCGVAAFNYYVDPFGIYQFDRADTERLSRIDQFYQMRVSKPWQIGQLKPSAVVIGTSRSGSIRPAHDSWGQQTAFNFSMPGMRPYELLRFIEHAQASGPLQKLAIGIDFEAFLYAQPTFGFGFNEKRLAESNAPLSSPRLAWAYAQDATTTLFTMHALSRSLSAVSGTGNSPRLYHPDGSWEKSNQRLTGKQGYLYIAKGRVNRHDDRTADLAENLAIFERTLRYCYEQKIDTRMFITPEHVLSLGLWFELGYEDYWREFHRGLLGINLRLAHEYDQTAFPIWGFNHLAGIADEAISPPQNEAKPYFLDGVHFRKELGELILDSLWSEGPQTGSQLDETNLEQYLDAVRQLSLQFAADNALLTQELHRQTP